MDIREEARIGCFILMLGTALATLSSLTGLGMIGSAGTGETIAIGVTVLGMVFAAGRILIHGSRLDSGIAVAAGFASLAVGWFLVGHQFLIAFPGVFAFTALISVAFAKDFPRGAGTPGARSLPPEPRH